MERRGCTSPLLPLHRNTTLRLSGLHASIWYKVASKFGGRSHNMHVTDHAADEYASRCLPFSVGSFVKTLIWCGIGQWWRQAVDTMLQVWRTLGQGLAANRPTEGRTMSGTSRGSPINPSLGQTSKGRAVSVEAALSYVLSKVTLCHFMWFWWVTGFLYCSWCSWEMYHNICMYIQRVLFLKGWSFSLSQWA